MVNQINKIKIKMPITSFSHCAFQELTFLEQEEQLVG
jgi:hypothetical protein